MNRIFKVIYSKTKKINIDVSENAKSAKKNIISSQSKKRLFIGLTAILTLNSWSYNLNYIYAFNDIGVVDTARRYTFDKLTSEQQKYLNSGLFLSRDSLYTSPNSSDDSNITNIGYDSYLIYNSSLQKYQIVRCDFDEYQVYNGDRRYQSYKVVMDVSDNVFKALGIGGSNYSAGSDISISSDNVISAKKTGKVASGDSGIITGGTVYNAIQDVKGNIKNYTAGTDISISDKYAISVNKDGLIEKANSGIVTGGTVFAVTNKLSNTLDSQKTQLNSATKRISSLASNISDLKDTIIDINTSVTSSIISSQATINGRLDTNLSNLTEDGKDVLKSYIRDEIKNVAKENMSKTKVGTQDMSNEAVMPNSSTLDDKADKADLDNLSKVVDTKANQSDVNAALDKKADKDNVYTKSEVNDKFSSVSNALDNKVDKADFNTVKNQVNTVKNQVDKNTTDIAKKADLAYVDSALSTKADKSEVTALERVVETKADKTALDALSKTVDKKADQAYVDNELSKKANLADFNLLKDTVSSNTDKITSNTEKISTNTKDIEGLKESKADVDGTNIDVSKFTEKLGVGKIEKDNAGLVTGGVVADALAYKADYGYVNAGFNALEGQMQQMNQSLTKNINQVGAGAAALAGLHPQEYDPNCKLDFAAGYGHYKNANATAIGMYYRPNAGTTISLAGTIGNGSPMLSAGLSFKIGYGKNVEKVMVTKDAFEAQQKENQEMKEQIQEQNQRIQEMEATLKQLLAK